MNNSDQRKQNERYQNLTHTLSHSSLDTKFVKIVLEVDASTEQNFNQSSFKHLRSPKFYLASNTTPIPTIIVSRYAMNRSS